ncbi:type IV pilin [Methanosarcina sp. Z-7115]|uniref:Type IV pilin n=1 Tax=Methanosarcina baikalica TaxID=3073890 RepID=A0ABU2CXJ8_9EURY|nr:type IV pilin [Methanosarcina sp. Z-7115]MDR7664287.1 type IV pilin [Methanosarcina sp. Z-7115]
MDFTKWFKNTHAVSPVIGVILMVAITVILAAAIGSSVFGQGPAKSAPQANLDIKAGPLDITGSVDIATIRIEHLGGDPIHFEDGAITKVMASVGSGQSYIIGAANNAITATPAGLGVFGVGSVKTLRLTDTAGANAFGAEPKSGETVHIKIIDVQTNQLICDTDIRIP